MKTIDLNAYGVSEINAAEMVEVDGGCLAIGWDMFWSGMKIGLGVGASIGYKFRIQPQNKSYFLDMDSRSYLKAGDLNDLQIQLFIPF
jgi:hypothetical protein